MSPNQDTSWQFHLDTFPHRSTPLQLPQSDVPGRVDCASPWAATPAPGGSTNLWAAAAASCQLSDLFFAGRPRSHRIKLHICRLSYKKLPWEIKTSDNSYFTFANIAARVVLSHDFNNSEIFQFSSVLCCSFGLRPLKSQQHRGVTKERVRRAPAVRWRAVLLTWRAQNLMTTSAQIKHRQIQELPPPWPIAVSRAKSLGSFPRQHKFWPSCLVAAFLWQTALSLSLHVCRGMNASFLFAAPGFYPETGWYWENFLLTRGFLHRFFHSFPLCLIWLLHLKVLVEPPEKHLLTGAIIPKLGSCDIRRFWNCRSTSILGCPTCITCQSSESCPVGCASGGP